LLKLLVLKVVKNVKVNMVMQQHNIWCINQIKRFLALILDVALTFTLQYKI